MRCPTCGQSIPPRSRFCLHCGKPVSPKNIEPSSQDSDYHTIFGSEAGNGVVMYKHSPESEATWGAQIFTQDKSSYGQRTRPHGCPDWVEERDWHRWGHLGLVVWDNINQKIGWIRAAKAVELLENLQSNANWKSQGIAIVEPSEWSILDDQPDRRRSRPSKKEAVSLPEPAQVAQNGREDERLRLTGRAAEELYDFLQANDAQLRKIAAETWRRFEEAERLFFDIMLEAHRRKELKNIALEGRKLTWEYREDSLAIVCECPPDRATIVLSEDKFFWRPVIERPNHLKQDLERFLELEEALNWVEVNLPRLRAEDEELTRTLEEERAADLAEIAALPTMDLSAYWIDPSALEPERITYRVIINLECEPYSYKPIEISFGQHWKLDKEYYPPTMLVRELQLSPSQVQGKQRIPGMGLYHIYSIVTYYDATLATAQAQRFWDQSAAVRLYQEKKVIRAQYGIEEVETEYCTWLGGVEAPNEPRPLDETRAEYLRKQALRATLLHALDVSGFRKFIQLSARYSSDEKLLKSMHEARSISPYVPAQARDESQRWLVEQPRQSSHEPEKEQARVKPPLRKRRPKKQR